MKISIIGAGTMGQMLARKLAAGHNSGNQLYIANRNSGKAAEFCAQNPAFSLAPDFQAAATHADVLLLCVQPQSIREVLQSLKTSLHPPTHLVSIAADVHLAQLESVYAGKITRIMPTILSEIDRGTTLLVRNGQVKQTDLELLTEIFTGKLNFREVSEAALDGFTTITSCGPGLYASLLEQFARSIQRSHPSDLALLAELLNEAMAGTCAYAQARQLSYQEVLTAVATKGGVTEQGAKLLHADLPAVFDRMNSLITQRHSDRTNQINAQFDR